LRPWLSSRKTQDAGRHANGLLKAESFAQKQKSAKANKESRGASGLQCSSSSSSSGCLRAGLGPVAEKQQKPRSERASAFGFLAVFPQCRPAEKKPQTACPSGSSEEEKKGRCAKRKRVEKILLRASPFSSSPSSPSHHHHFLPRELTYLSFSFKNARVEKE